MNIDFNRRIGMKWGGTEKVMNLTNSFGPVYPTLYDDLLVDMFQIKSGDRVLDIGGGANPFKRADVVTEPFLDNTGHRSGHAIRPDIDYVGCFAENLPFADNEFDFVISRQVFEHTSSPQDACREMMRVGKRGFIETPNKSYELLFGPNPSHNWFVTLRDGVLEFERRMFIRHPLRHMGLGAVNSSPEGQYLLHWEFKNLTNVQFYWENRFDFEVADYPDGFSYQNPDHGSQAHLDMAICGLLHGGFYLEQRENDAYEATALQPNWALAHNTLGVTRFRQGKTFEAQIAFETAARLEPREEYLFNAELKNPFAKPILVDFEDALPMDETYAKQFIMPSCFNIFAYMKS